MKHFLRRFFVVAVAAALSVTAVSFAACGGKPEEEIVHVEAVLLDQTSITIDIDEEQTLTAIVDINATNRNVTWSSDNTAVATVDQTGKVKGVSAGSAVITVTTEDGGKTATCAVTVNAAAVLTVKALNALATASAGENVYDTLVFLSDGTYSATGKFLGAVDFSYKSTYTVTDGVLSVPNPGPNTSTSFGEFPTYPTIAVVGDTVEFTVMSNNGEDITLAKYVLTKAEADVLGVTVGEPIVNVAVTGITLSQNTLTLTSGTKANFSEIVQIAPADATNKNYTVTIKEGSAAEVLKEDNGILGVKEGTATVVITTEDGNFTAECEITVAYPAKPADLGEVYFESETSFTCMLDYVVMQIYQTYTFGTDGKIYVKQGLAEAMQTLGGVGYYSLVKDGDTITKVKLYRFDQTSAGVTEHDVTTQDGKLVISYVADSTTTPPTVLTLTEKTAG